MGLRKARKELDELRNASDFWKMWVAYAEFSKNVSKRFEAANIIHESSAAADSMKTLVDDLLEQANHLKRMHKARSEK